MCEVLMALAALMPATHELAMRVPSAGCINTDQLAFTNHIPDVLILGFVFGRIGTLGGGGTTFTP